MTTKHGLQKFTDFPGCSNFVDFHEQNSQIEHGLHPDSSQDNPFQFNTVFALI